MYVERIGAINIAECLIGQETCRRQERWTLTVEMVMLIATHPDVWERAHIRPVLQRYLQRTAGQRAHLYSAWFTVLSVVPESRTPPQPGQRMFHDISKMPRRALCRKAAITSSSSSLCSAANARALMRQSSRSGASSMSFSIALTGSGFADCRKTLKRASISPEIFMA